MWASLLTDYLSGLTGSPRMKPLASRPKMIYSVDSQRTNFCNYVCYSKCFLESGNESAELSIVPLRGINIFFRIYKQIPMYNVHIDTYMVLEYFHWWCYMIGCVVLTLYVCVLFIIFRFYCAIVKSFEWDIWYNGSLNKHEIIIP